MMSKCFRKCSILDYCCDGEYIVEEGGCTDVVDQDELVMPQTGFRIKMLCFDPQLGSTIPYEDEPAANPIHFTRDDAFAYACKLAQDEADYLNKEGNGISFSISEDDDYRNKKCVRVIYTENAEQMTTFCIEEVSFAIMTDDEAEEDETEI